MGATLKHQFAATPHTCLGINPGQAWRLLNHPWCACLLACLQVLDLSQTPDLETPQYTVLRVTKDYEIRRYEPFVVAEAPMGPGSSECFMWFMSFMCVRVK